MLEKEISHSPWVLSFFFLILASSHQDILIYSNKFSKLNLLQQYCNKEFEKKTHNVARNSKCQIYLLHCYQLSIVSSTSKILPKQKYQEKNELLALDFVSAKKKLICISYISDTGFLNLPEIEID